MNKYIQKLLNEQFNASDLDFSGDNDAYDNNIFNKNIVIPAEVYRNIIDGKNVEYREIIEVGTMVSAVKVESKDDLIAIIDFYSENYPNESLNWLDVSGITDMSRLFALTDYNGDISKWDVSNVTDMDWIFQYSKFNQNISKWDLSNV